MFDWIIIGGGVQGMTSATYLLQSNKTTTSKLRIIDPHKKPLENWKRCTDTISMPYLRSPAVHHMDINPSGLRNFSKQFSEDSFYGRYQRPSLALFNKHCDHLYQDLKLHECWIQGRVTEVKKKNQHWQIIDDEGNTLEANNIIIAIGIGEQPFWPEWALELRKEGKNIHHIFEDSLDIPSLTGPIAVIGGGMTAAHLANKLAALFPREVTMVKRHPFRVKLFDSDPGWLGPKNQISFRKNTDYSRRRKEIVDARHRGSITQDLHIKLIHLKKKGHLDWMDEEIDSFKLVEEGTLLETKTGKELFAKTIILATGFVPTLPGKEWITPLIKREKLKCAECGYPIVSSHLEWAEGLYVTGALAELQIGPIARNISGARQAAEKIVSGIKIG